MGEIAEMHLDGTLCECCGEFLDGESPGYPRYCTKSCANNRGIDVDNGIDNEVMEEEFNSFRIKLLEKFDDTIIQCLNAVLSNNAIFTHRKLKRFEKQVAFKFLNKVTKHHKKQKFQKLPEMEDMVLF